jgi:hypothetical protein
MVYVLIWARGVLYARAYTRKTTLWVIWSVFAVKDGSAARMDVTDQFATLELV